MYIMHLYASCLHTKSCALFYNTFTFHQCTENKYTLVHVITTTCSVHLSALQGLPFELNRKVFSDDLNVSTLWIFIISFLLIQVPVTMFAWRVVHISLLQVLFGFRRFQFVLIESTSSYDWQVGWVHDVSDTLILYHTIVVILLLKYWWDVSKMNWMIGISIFDTIVFNYQVSRMKKKKFLNF